MYYYQLSINEKINVKSWYRECRYHGVKLLDEVIFDLPILFSDYARRYISEPCR